MKIIKNCLVREEKPEKSDTSDFEDNDDNSSSLFFSQAFLHELLPKKKRTIFRCFCPSEVATQHPSFYRTFFLMLFYLEQIRHAIFRPPTNCSWKISAVVSIHLAWLLDKLRRWTSPVQGVLIVECTILAHSTDPPGASDRVSNSVRWSTATCFSHSTTALQCVLLNHRRYFQMNCHAPHLTNNCIVASSVG